MEEMGIKKFNETSDLELELELEKIEKIEKIYISREMFINKFIEKFPKANLHTLVQINKYYNKKNNNRDTNKLDNNISTNFIHDYLLILN